MKTRLFAIIISLILITIVAVSAIDHIRAADRLVILIPVAADMAAGGALDNQSKALSKIIAKKLGIEVVAETYVYPQSVLPSAHVAKALRAKQADISMLYSIDYAMYKKSGGSGVTPLFTLTVNKKTALSVCFYTRKGEFKSVSELRGKKWGAPELVPTRYLLYTAGINEPLGKFFSTLTHTLNSPVNNSFDMLANKQLDVVASYDMIVNMAGILNQKNSPFEPFYCKEYEHTWLFVTRSDLDPDLTVKIRDIMFNSHKDPDFAPFRFMFTMFNGKFAPIDEKALSMAMANADIVMKNKWYAEEAAFLKKYPPVKAVVKKK